MKKSMMTLALATALIGTTWAVRADDTNATGNNNNAITHPVNAYQNHEVKEDMKDSRENHEKAKEAKATYKQAKADYEKALKENGAESDVTKAAKSRMEDARKDMLKYSRKTTKANQELKKDESKAQEK